MSAHTPNTDRTAPPVRLKQPESHWFELGLSLEPMVIMGWK